MTDKTIENDYTSLSTFLFMENKTIITSTKLQEIIKNRYNDINFITKLIDFFMNIYTGKHKRVKLLKIFHIITHENEMISHNIGIDKLFSFLHLIQNSIEDAKKNFTFTISDNNRVDLIYHNVILGYFNINAAQINIIGSLINQDGSIRCSQINKFIIEYSYHAIIELEQQKTMTMQTFNSIDIHQLKLDGKHCALDFSPQEKNILKLSRLDQFKIKNRSCFDARLDVGSNNSVYDNKENQINKKIETVFKVFNGIKLTPEPFSIPLVVGLELIFFNRFYGEDSATFFIFHDSQSGTFSLVMEMLKVPGVPLNKAGPCEFNTDTFECFFSMVIRMRQLGMAHGDLDLKNIFYDKNSKNFFPLNMTPAPIFNKGIDDNNSNLSINYLIEIHNNIL